MTYGIGRRMDGSLALCTGEDKKTIFDGQDIARGAAFDSPELPGLLRNINGQMQMVAPWSGPIAISEEIAITYAEAEDLLKFLLFPQDREEGSKA